MAPSHHGSFLDTPRKHRRIACAPSRSSIFHAIEDGRDNPRLRPPAFSTGGLIEVPELPDLPEDEARRGKREARACCFKIDEGGFDQYFRAAEIQNLCHLQRPRREVRIYTHTQGAQAYSRTVSTERSFCAVRRENPSAQKSSPVD